MQSKIGGFRLSPKIQENIQPCMINQLFICQKWQESQTVHAKYSAQKTADGSLKYIFKSWGN